MGRVVARGLVKPGQGKANENLETATQNAGWRVVAGWG